MRTILIACRRQNTVSIDRLKSRHYGFNGGGMIQRRRFLVTAIAIATTPLTTLAANATQEGAMQSNKTHAFWPAGARLVISISMQMEAGAQPESGAESPLPKIGPSYPDVAATNWYEYGFNEALPRL